MGEAEQSLILEGYAFIPKVSSETKFIKVNVSSFVKVRDHGHLL